MSASTVYSAGPNASATPASAGAMNDRSTIDAVPPMNEATAATPSAGPASPRRASACPSNAVTTVDASPGSLSSTDVMVPPYCAP
jgi:hypothetical protein